jgi:hypothetical protein
MTAVRVTIQPYTINAQALSGLGIFTGSGPGCDATGTGTAFASWASLGTPLGIQYVNNGTQFLMVTNGATVTAANVLVGRKGGGGFLPAYNQTATTIAIPASTTMPIPIGPLSVQDFTQTDASQYSGALSPAGVIGTAGVGMTCIDFTNTTTLAVRLYQLIPAVP